MVEVGKSNQVQIGPLAELGQRSLTASQVNWQIDPPGTTFRSLVQIRYNSCAWPAQVTRLDERRIEVEFDEPQNGVAPGQAVVCYDDQTVMGGGWIDS